MIYCVVPQALADELYDKLVEYYRDDPNVKVIVDRRSPAGGAPDPSAPEAEPPARRQRDRPRDSAGQNSASGNSARSRRS